MNKQISCFSTFQAKHKTCMFSTMIEEFVRAGIINPQDISLLTEEAEKLGKKLSFIDATFVLPTSEENINENYLNKRIPGAVFFDIKAIADKASELPHMLPHESDFSQAVSDLGISNDDILILYGQHGMIMGPARVWWMFRGFGHDNVLVLNGGLPAWEKAGLETESGEHAKPVKSNYAAFPFKPEMVIQMSDVLTASNENSCLIIDARPAQRFSGKSPEPRDNMRSGHIPNAVSMPCSKLVDENGQFRPAEQIAANFEQCGVFLEDESPKRIITTCGSGITACALSLALHHLDFKNVAVYDGSWSEWGLESSQTPVETA